jgi:hypothetical protein
VTMAQLQCNSNMERFTTLYREFDVDEEYEDIVTRSCSKLNY